MGRETLNTSTLPDFFIVGAAKSGTTTLYRWLDQHPEVYMASFKEPHWFSRVKPNPRQLVSSVTSEEEYRKLFKDRRGELAVGEASPSYLWDSEAPYRIKEVVPEAKIIAILRHPVERAHSHYLMDVKEGNQNRPFVEALIQDYRAQAKGWGISHLYVELGFYAEQVRRYLEAFGGKQVRVYLYEDLREDPRGLLESLLDFLEVDPDYAGSIQTDLRFNEYSIPRNRLAKSAVRSRRVRLWVSRMMPGEAKAWARRCLLFKKEAKPPIEVEAKQFLMELYRTDILKLEGLLERDLGHWLRTDGAKRP